MPIKSQQGTPQTSSGQQILKSLVSAVPRFPHRHGPGKHKYLFRPSVSMSMKETFKRALLEWAIPALRCILASQTGLTTEAPYTVSKANIQKHRKREQSWKEREKEAQRS